MPGSATETGDVTVHTPYRDGFADRVFAIGKRHAESAMLCRRTMHYSATLLVTSISA